MGAPAPSPGDPPSVPLQEWMAHELTALSNERTLLGYVRTALAFVAAGFGLIHFFTDPALVTLGIVFAAIGAVLAAWGVHRFQRTRRLIRAHTPLGGTEPTPR